jgi:YHS domain-containing protein
MGALFDLLDLLLLLVTVRAVWKLAGGVMSGLKGAPGPRSGARGAPPRGVQMARDPVCGTFVVPDHAISLTVGHDRLYFCSAACRDQFRPSTGSGRPEPAPERARTA